MISNPNNDMNVFEVVKKFVTARQAADRYGIHVNRHGMAVCPFHPDSNPSMKLDNRFHCFACQADGDAIDFVSRLFQLPSKEAAVKLADDFGIPYDIHRKPEPKPQIREPTEVVREEESFPEALTQHFKMLRQWEAMYAPQSPDEEWHPLFVAALQEKDHVEGLLENFLYATPEEQTALQNEYNQEVGVIERRIRNHDSKPDR